MPDRCSRFRRSVSGSVSALIVLLSVAFSASPPALGQSPRPLVAFGDSITAGLGDEGVDCFDASTFAGYPIRLRMALGSRGISVGVDNQGICGETTAEALSRIDEVAAGARDVGLFVLMEGTNDISVLNGVTGIETIRANLAELARRAAEYRLEPVYASVIPRGPDAGRDGNNAFASILRDRVQDLAASEDRAFVDAFAALFDPDVFEFFYSDTFHPNTPGYDILASAFTNPVLEAWSRVGAPATGPCLPNPSRLCLNQGRFELTVDWQKPNGERGIGRAVGLTQDSGYFYFFREDNIELVVKVLDGRMENGNFWVFYGALSNLQYTLTVRDTETEMIKQYVNPRDNFGSVGDTQAFDVSTASSTASVRVAEPARETDVASRLTALDRQAFPAAETLPLPAAKMGVCLEDDETLCLNQSRFEIRVDWRKPNGTTGTGKAALRTPDTGMFYFFRESNVELVVKILDGRTENGHFWVFYGALSNVEYTITVVDTATGRTRIYLNPQDNFGSVGDTQAFETPPGG